MKHRIIALLACLCGTFPGITSGQDRTVLFSTSDTGADRSVITWGMGTIGGFNVMQSGIINMGADEIDVVIMPFTLKDPLTDGDISAESKALINAGMAEAHLAACERNRFDVALNRQSVKTSTHKCAVVFSRTPFTFLTVARLGRRSRSVWSFIGR